MEEKTKEKMTITASLVEPMALGDIFIQSGLFGKDVKTKAEAVVKILAGKELGLAPIESMANIYIVNGKVVLQSKIIGALIKRSKKYDYIIDKLDENQCEITFYLLEDGKKVEIGKSKFTTNDAAKAGIINKEVWKSYPRNMLFARALVNGSRWYCADVYCGYEQEESEGISANKEAVKLEIDSEGNEIKREELNGETVEVKEEDIQLEFPMDEE